VTAYFILRVRETVQHGHKTLYYVWSCAKNIYYMTYEYDMSF